MAHNDTLRTFENTQEMQKTLASAACVFYISLLLSNTIVFFNQHRVKHGLGFFICKNISNVSVSLCISPCVM